MKKARYFIEFDFEDGATRALLHFESKVQTEKPYVPVEDEELCPDGENSLYVDSVCVYKDTSYISFQDWTFNRNAEYFDSTIDEFITNGWVLDCVQTPEPLMLKRQMRGEEYG